MEKEEILDLPDSNDSTETLVDRQIEYPRLVTRFKAMIIDGIVILTGIILAGTIFRV